MRGFAGLVGLLIHLGRLVRPRDAICADLSVGIRSRVKGNVGDAYHVLSDIHGCGEA